MVGLTATLSLVSLSCQSSHAYLDFLPNFKAPLTVTRWLKGKEVQIESLQYIFRKLWYENYPGLDLLVSEAMSRSTSESLCKRN
jgi:hypothetical protein